MSTLAQKAKLDEYLRPMELEALRKQEEFEKKVEDGLLPINENIITEVKKTIKYRTRHNPIKQQVKYKQNLDLTIQEDADRFSMHTIFNKVVNGEPTPLGSIKDGLSYSEENYSDSDLTDLHVINDYFTDKYGKDLKQVYNDVQQQANDDLNDNSDTVVPSTEKTTVTTENIVKDETK